MVLTNFGSNDLIYHFYGTFFIMSDLDMTRMFLKAFDSDLKSPDPILSLKQTY